MAKLPEFDPRTVQAIRKLGLGRELTSQGLPLEQGPIGREQFEGIKPLPDTYTTIGTQRVSIAGGPLVSYLTHPAALPFERRWRRLPEDGIFSASPSRSFTFECGSIPVPSDQSFVLMDYYFNIYRPSGITPGDSVPLESNRLSTQIGWDITASSQRQGNIAYELTPIAPDASQAAFGTATFVNGGIIPGQGLARASQDQFTAAAQNANQTPAGPGLSMLPQRHFRDGIMKTPVPWVIPSSSQLQFKCCVFNKITIPIAFFEVNMFGLLLPSNLLSEMLAAVAPMVAR